MSRYLSCAVVAGFLQAWLLLLPLQAAPIVLNGIPGLGPILPSDHGPFGGVVVSEVGFLSQSNVMEGQTGEITYRLTNLTRHTVEILGFTNVGSTPAFPDPTDGVTNTFIAPGGCLEAELVSGQSCLYRQVFQTGAPDGASGPLFDGTALVFNRVRYIPMGMDESFPIRSAFAAALVSISDFPVPEPDVLLLVGGGLVALGWLGRRRRARQ